MKPFSKQVQIDFRTGVRKEIKYTGAPKAQNYFKSLNILNVDAGLYGVVYLASNEALTALCTMDLKEEI